MSMMVCDLCGKYEDTDLNDGAYSEDGGYLCEDCSIEDEVKK